MVEEGDEDRAYIYIKESLLGLKYLGITRQDPYGYSGSGVYWRNHLKKYKFSNSKIKTTVLVITRNQKELSTLCMYFSELYNIVESEEWANLIPEFGESGTYGIKLSDEHKNKISKGNKGLKRTEESKKRYSIAKKGVIFSLEHRKKLSEIASNRSKELRQRISDTLKGTKLSEITKNKISDFHRTNKTHCKPIIQYDKYWNFIREWDSIAEVCRNTCLCRDSIKKALDDYTKSSGKLKYKWKYKNIEDGK